jgi:hypothetical protein
MHILPDPPGDLGAATMNRRRVTWAEAEQVCPGIEAEWRSMLGTKITTEHLLDGRLVRVPSPCPPAGKDWRVELTDDGKVVIVQCDPEGRWHSPPEWRHHGRGHWTSPMPLPHALLFHMDLVYEPLRIKMHAPHRPVHFITIDATVGDPPKNWFDPEELAKLEDGK